MFHLLFLKIYPQQQKQWHKDPLYIYCNTHDYKFLIMKELFP